MDTILTENLNIDKLPRRMAPWDQKIMKKDYDWFGFWVHFFFGALLGIFLGFTYWMRWGYEISESVSFVTLVVGGNMVFWGLVAGVLRDRLWSR